MSTLGLSGPPQSSEGLWKRLFWPSVENANDADLAATRGFWICFVLAFVSYEQYGGNVGISVGFSFGWIGLATFLFYFLGACGVRQGSVAASASMFTTYLLDTVFYFWVSPFHFSFLRLIGVALFLTNLRACILIQGWRKDPLRQEDFDYGPPRMNATWRDKLVDQMPTRIWPWGRAIFYALAVLLVPLECLGVVQLLRSHA